MLRRTLLVATLAIVPGGPAARGGDPDDVRKLNDRIELLEAKLELAEKEIALLRREIDGLKPKGEVAKRALSELLSDGTLLSGDYKFANAKVPPGEVTVTIKSRDGQKFKGTHAAVTKNIRTTAEIEGEIDGNRIAYKRIGTGPKFGVTGTMNGETVECEFTDEAGDVASMRLKVAKQPERRR
jgi:hypothetical protein